MPDRWLGSWPQRRSVALYRCSSPQGRRSHGRYSALLLGLGAAPLMVSGLYDWLPLAFVGFGAVILAATWNLRLVSGCTIPSSISA